MKHPRELEVSFRSRIPRYAQPLVMAPAVGVTVCVAEVVVLDLEVDLCAEGLAVEVALEEVIETEVPVDDVVELVILATPLVELVAAKAAF